MYENCTYVADTQPWCATAVDENGHMVSNDWGYCTAACPVMRHSACRTGKFLKIRYRIEFLNLR